MVSVYLNVSCKEFVFKEICSIIHICVSRCGNVDSPQHFLIAFGLTFLTRFNLMMSFTDCISSLSALMGFPEKTQDTLV